MNHTKLVCTGGWLASGGCLQLSRSPMDTFSYSDSGLANSFISSGRNSLCQPRPPVGFLLRPAPVRRRAAAAGGGTREQQSRTEQSRGVPTETARVLGSRTRTLLFLGDLLLLANMVLLLNVLGIVPLPGNGKEK